MIRRERNRGESGDQMNLAAIARRHRFGQSVLFAVTVCLLVATAAVDPLLTRSFGAALVSFHEHQQGVAGSSVVLQSGGMVPLPVKQLEHAVDARVRAVTAQPIASSTALINDLANVDEVRLQHTDGQCAHVHIIRGRCPTARNEVMVSQAAVSQTTRLKVGASVPVSGAYGYPTAYHPNPRKTLRIVGIFTASDADPFWGGASIGDYVPPAQAGIPGPVEYWLTDSATFSGPLPVAQGFPIVVDPATFSWLGITHTLSYPVNPAKLTPARLTAAVAGIQATEDTVGTSVSVTESLSAVYTAVRVDLHQVGQILPFLLLQLGLVLLILLVQVTSYFATVRRGEAAVLKMRGNGTAGILRLGAQEFAPAASAGVVGGLALAYVVDGLVRHLWLPGTVAAAWDWTAMVATFAAAALAGVVWLSCWCLMARESISSLLRSRPSLGHRAHVSTPAAVLGVMCVSGVALTVTHNLTGAPVQLAPVLLAGLVAIALGALLPPLAAWLVRRLLRRRRAAGALAVAQLSRRAGASTAVATLIITSALLTLSVSLFARAADNRAARAAADLGAAAVVNATVGADVMNGQSFMNAVDAVDPHHRYFTPAVQINASSPTSNTTIGVVPAQMAYIGTRVGLSRRIPWSALATGGPASRPNALIATWTTNAAVGSTVAAPTMDDANGLYHVVGAAPYIPGVGASTIVVDLRTMLSAGDRQDNLSYQVFSATQDPRRLATLQSALRTAGFASTQVRTTQQVRAGYAATATAWATNLSIVVSALSVLAALTSVVLVAVASRADRQRDLRALRTGGISQRVLQRATVDEFVLLALAGSVIGALTAPVAAWLTGPTMLWWSTPPAQPLTRTSFQWQSGAIAALSLIVLLVLVGTVFGTRLARSVGTEPQGHGAK
ncbi:hypothetical protein [Flexivirga caeni]|nr:hypothetical protein [Flexivirga caeni]